MRRKSVMMALGAQWLIETTNDNNKTKIRASRTKGAID